MTDTPIETQQWTDKVPEKPALNPLYITPVRIDGDIVLMRYKHPSTGEKEYWSQVLGEPVDAQLDHHWKRASEAVESARKALPGIRAKIEARRAEMLAQQQAEQDARAVTLEQIKAETGDVGPQADKAENCPICGEGHPLTIEGPGAYRCPNCGELFTAHDLIGAI